MLISPFRNPCTAALVLVALAGPASAKPDRIFKLEHDHAPASRSSVERFTCARVGSTEVEMEIASALVDDHRRRWRVASLQVGGKAFEQSELSKVNAAIGFRFLDTVTPLCRPDGGVAIHVRTWTRPPEGIEGDGTFGTLRLTVSPESILSFSLTDD